MLVSTRSAAAYGEKVHVLEAAAVWLECALAEGARPLYARPALFTGGGGYICALLAGCARPMSKVISVSVRVAQQLRAHRAET